MAIVRPSAASRAGGLYRAVCERIEDDARRHAQRIAGWPADPLDRVHRNPMQRILDALRAGEPTDVPAWAIPRSARGDQCMMRGRTTGEKREATCFYVAIVRPDDTVEFKPDNGDKWLEYNGLLDDNFGTPPQQYDRYPTSTKYRGPR